VLCFQVANWLRYSKYNHNSEVKLNFASKPLKHRECRKAQLHCEPKWRFEHRRNDAEPLRNYILQWVTYSEWLFLDLYFLSLLKSYFYILRLGNTQSDFHKITAFCRKAAWRLQKAYILYIHLWYKPCRFCIFLNYFNTIRGIIKKQHRIHVIFYLVLSQIRYLK